VNGKTLLDRATLVGYNVVEIARYLNFGTGTALANRQLNTPRGVVAYRTAITPLDRASTRTSIFSLLRVRKRVLERYRGTLQGPAARQTVRGRRLNSIVLCLILY
jgi:hypothetical protein